MTASRSCRAFLAHQSQATAQARAAADAKEREALIGAFVKHNPVKIERGTLMQIIEATLAEAGIAFETRPCWGHGKRYWRVDGRRVDLAGLVAVVDGVREKKGLRVIKR